MSNGPPIIVVGAGLTGMAVALMLAKRKLPVVVLERDSRDAFGRSEEHPVPRIGAPHTNRPHTLLAGGREVLRRSLPEVADEVYKLGARNSTAWPGSPATPDLTVVSLRRTLLEQALLACAENLPTLTLRFGERVRDLIVTGDRCPQVSGVRTDATALPARLVIDATGAIHNPTRRAAECPGGDCISLRSRIYYTSRPLRLTRRGFDAAQGAGAIYIESPAPFVAHVRIFPHDAPYASILLLLHGEHQIPSRQMIDEAYRSVMADDKFQSYCRGAVYLAPIETVGYTKTKLRLLDNERPFQPGLLQIGDALATVNPLTSRGASLGLLQAEALAAAIARDVSDYTGQQEAVLRTYHEYVVPNWADGLLRGNYLGADLNLPNEVNTLIDRARRRHRRVQDIRAAARRESGIAYPINQATELATRVGQLLAPPSMIDTLAEPLLESVQ